MIGYITGSFDLLHKDHYRLLKAAKQRCTFLIVGLVTDQLGEIQKRVPILSYEHRRSHLENSRDVDLVVEHDGCTKYTSWKKLKFDILFSSDEYYMSNEFCDFERVCPQVKIVYIPRNNTTSSTKIIENIARRFTNKQNKIISIGVGGTIFKYDNSIIKQINVSAKEYDEFTNRTGTADVMNFMRYNGKLPRNYKGKKSAVTTREFPMIAGVNVCREIVAGKIFKLHKWCTFISCETVFVDAQNNTDAVFECPENIEIFEFAKMVDTYRRFPKAILNISQRDGGITLDNFLKKDIIYPEKMLADITIQIHDICKTLKDNRCVHGDIHSSNLLVDDKIRISLIDFGWCLMDSFEMCSIEKKMLKEALEDNFDFKHFKNSLKMEQNQHHNVTSLLKLIV
jgi:glycerol-3-phosphate cytidylyltransferase